MSEKETIDFSEEMRSSYLDYALSVLIGRAIPDCRDGNKPVHRRILFAMYEMSLTNNHAHKKCAAIVGKVLGSTHPHGDGSVYGALVRMAQDFSLNAPLIDGQGNFGSLDGDPPAAYRYTEARLSKIAEELLESLEKNAVDFVPNYDGSTSEPSVLPVKYPNLIVNGSSGIAVGMATEILPFNLKEIIDATIKLIKSNEISDKKFYDCIKGPDFPTGAIITSSREAILEAMKTGRGSLSIRPHIEIEKNDKNNRTQVIITDIAYQTNKGKQIEKISEIIKNKKFRDIHELRDESDGSGVRVVFELKFGSDSEKVIEFLLNHTSLQTTVSMNNLAIVDGAPKTLSVRQIVEEFIKFRRTTVIRVSQYDLKKNEHKVHILEGLIKATKNIDEIIKIIRECKKDEGPKSELMKKFSFSDEQAQSILDMKLSKLTKFEHKKLTDEYDTVKEAIKKLKKIIDDKDERDSLIIEELQEISKKYGRDRMTEIMSTAG